MGQFRGGELKYGAEPKQNVGRRGVEALNDWASKAGSDTDLYVFSHGSWIAQTVQTVLGLGAIHPDFADVVSMGNAHWVRFVAADMPDRHVAVAARRLQSWSGARRHRPVGASGPIAGS